MRFRRTAPPSAFLMLQPNRLRSKPLRRRKTVNSRLERRFPSRYTASYSLRRSRRQSRGSPRGDPSDACEAVTSLLTACCKNFYSAFRLHAGAKTVLFVPAALMWLIRSLGQRNFSCFYKSGCWWSFAQCASWSACFAAGSEFTSVCEPCRRIKKTSAPLVRKASEQNPLFSRLGSDLLLRPQELSTFLIEKPRLEISACQLTPCVVRPELACRSRCCVDGKMVELLCSCL